MEGLETLQPVLTQVHLSNFMLIWKQKTIIHKTYNKVNVHIDIFILKWLHRLLKIKQILIPNFSKAKLYEKWSAVFYFLAEFSLTFQN